MMRKKRLLLFTLAISLILPSFLVDAASTKSSKTTSDGELTSKDEVVYATLHASGELEEIYVVNNLDVKKEGTIVDYGPYKSIKNLTDLSEIEQEDNAVRIDAPKGKFYYQGDMKEESELPWNISISYLLNGKEIAPGELAGKDGDFQLKINTSPNENVDKIFFENYLLQISLTLSPDIFTNIEVPDGMVANAGKDKQITFTVMPEKEGELSLEADVVDFELQGIDIAAVPSSMAIDAPDMDEMTGEMTTLTNAISDVNKGVGELEKGVTELNDGVASLRNGSELYKNGAAEISNASSELVTASTSIDQALATINKNLESSDEVDMTELQNLPKGLSQIASGLNETGKGLNTLRENYSVALSTLDKAMKAIPEHQITEEQMKSLYMSGADQTVLDQLTETYKAARTAKGTYSAVKEGFDAVNSTLETISGSIKEMETALTTIANGLTSSLEGMDMTDSLTKLQEGIASLSANYGEFHTGLVSYTGGVNQLSNSYSKLHSGIDELSGGTNELEKGVSELHNGTDELSEKTSDIPNQMQEEIDSMIAEFDKSDFEAKSFVSPENEKINSVQFVIKTENIKKEEKETKEVHVEEEKGFWTRLLDLF